MSYLLVLWESDNSVSVVSKSSKSIVSINGRDITFRWPRKGIFKGKIISSSGIAVLPCLLLALYFNIIILLLGVDFKKEMEWKAKEMVTCDDEKDKDAEQYGNTLTSSGASNNISSNG